MQFHGARGTLASPFVIPTDTLRITRRVCDDPQKTSFPANAPDDVRTVVVVRPLGDKIHAIVLRRGTTDEPCPPNSDAFTTACQTALGTAGQADCFNVMNYTVQPAVVDIEFPNLPSSLPPRATSSLAAVAVLRKDDVATVCGQLAKAVKNHCSDAIGAQPELLACIDQIGLPVDSTSPCGDKVLHPLFPAVKVLPVPNDIKAVCRKTTGGLSCDPQPADELRYGVDGSPPGPRNVLVPVSWKRSLDDCGGQSLRIFGEVRSPCDLQIPANKPPPQQARNTWLESYTFDGRQNFPEFKTEKPSNLALNRFTGTSDEPFSILRFGAFYGMCSSSPGELCNRSEQCSALGDTCDTICTNNNGRCGLGQPPCSGGRPCGRLHDFSQEFGKGRWRLARDPQSPHSCHTSGNRHGLCEDDPTKLCNVPAQCPSGDCASYLLTLGGCESPAAGTTLPSMRLDPLPADLPPKFHPLLKELGILPTSVESGTTSTTTGRLLVAASSEDAIALIVPARMLLGKRAAQCRSLGMDDVLVAASVRDCTNDHCVPTCPPLGAGALVPRLAVYGTRVRFLQFPEVAAPGMFDALGLFFQRIGRFFGRIFGGTEDQAALPSAEAHALLRILDTRSSAVTTVGEVVLNPQFDPLAVGQSGATKLLAFQKGRCVDSLDGRVLGIPSFCDPAQTGECPAWAPCKMTAVVMVMDLSRAP
jgi:hypothetical protein